MSSEGSGSKIRLRAEMCAPSSISLTDSEILSDIVFVCGDDFIPVKSHKLILRNWSTFFSKIVECSLSIQGPFPVTPIVVLKEVPGQDLQDILKFIYTGNLVVEQSRVKSLLKTAKFLELVKLPEQLEASELVKAPLNESLEIDHPTPRTGAPLAITMCPHPQPPSPPHLEPQPQPQSESQPQPQPSQTQSEPQLQSSTPPPPSTPPSSSKPPQDE
ncbi:broad-complex core protein isoforms 1/2/3/4/5-like [Panonychus citri]|uniref:broad-complex core protein isoforms 1/2/3/4/5-like n=1 Tax=Panonychus citri TaxID=50023 RepID=UPI002306F6DF|nr:broad-complex core protein isoforms 1/2/3/4/5-like [Panonychus citri]